MSRIAMCRCGEPLVSTLAFRKFEFYCVSCGRKYGWLDPTPADETPELLARTAAVKEEWRVLSEGILAEGGMHHDCPTCEKDREPHWLHATDEEKAADVAAHERIRQRLGAVGAPR